MATAGSLLVLLTAWVLVDNAGAVTISLKNSCPFTVWPGWITGDGGGLLQAAGSKVAGGGQLATGQFVSLDVPSSWGGRFWGRTRCDFDDAGAGSCQTGDCGGALGCGAAGGTPPVTLAEFKLDGYGGKDFYDVSLVDGYNLPVRIQPEAAGCSAVGCHSDVNAHCPRELQLLAAANGAASTNGGAATTTAAVIGCKSACEAFQTDAFCCRGAYSASQSCPPSNYSRLFKAHCPQAYSYAYDDLTSTFTCEAGSGYVIEFCPAGGDEQPEGATNGPAPATAPRRAIVGHHHLGRPRGRGHHNRK